MTPAMGPAMRHPPHARQRGWASLAIGVILLAIISLAGLYVSRTVIVDLRTSANKQYGIQLFSEAESLIDEALIDADYRGTTPRKIDLTTAAFWGSCTTFPAIYKDNYKDGNGTQWSCTRCTRGVDNTGQTTWSCDNTATDAQIVDAVVFARPVPAGGAVTWDSLSLVYANALATDDNGTRRLVRTAFSGRSILALGDTLPPPIMAAGNVPLNGTFSVVANPNGGGPGVPVSIWSARTIDAPQGSAATCQLGDFLLNNDCTTGALSNNTVGKGIDIVDNDPNFPQDVFEYLFGVPASNYQSIKDLAKQADQLYSNCNDIAGKSGLVWVTGACTISGTNNGTETAPLLLVVEKADITMNAQSTFNGILFAFDKDGDAGNIKINGGATLRGVILSNDNTELGAQINGTFNLIYSPQISRDFTDPIESSLWMIVRQPRTWIDYIDQY